MATIILTTNLAECVCVCVCVGGWVGGWAGGRAFVCLFLPVNIGEIRELINHFRSYRP